MSASEWFLIGMACAAIGSLIALVLLRANGRDESAEAAADSIRQQLERDDELRTYTHRPHVRAMTEPMTK